MTTDDTVRRIEDRLRPMLEEGARRLKRSYPDVNFWVRGLPVGSRTELQGYSLAIECLVDAADDQPDHVALEIVIRHLPSEPIVDAADVCWGHPSGHVEGRLDVEEQPYDGEALKALEQGIPELLGALEAALKRGGPPVERG